MCSVQMRAVCSAFCPWRSPYSVKLDCTPGQRTYTRCMAAPWISLQSAGLTAQIDPLGAQLSVLRDVTGRELLWQGDPAIWAGRAPLLFPIVGTLADGAYRLGKGASARHFELPRHGFARNSGFE